jgi:hypothetical protein
MKDLNHRLGCLCFPEFDLLKDSRDAVSEETGPTLCQDQKIVQSKAREGTLAER